MPDKVPCSLPISGDTVAVSSAGSGKLINPRSEMLPSLRPELSRNIGYLSEEGIRCRDSAVPEVGPVTSYIYCTKKRPRCADFDPNDKHRPAVFRDNNGDLRIGVLRPHLSRHFACCAWVLIIKIGQTISLKHLFREMGL